MRIKINLDKDFERHLSYLKGKYGDKMAKLNGFADSQLDYTEFIDNFIDSDNLANATIDPNSNANQKDVRGLLDEMAKPHQKLLSYNKIFYEIKKKHGLEKAREWLELDYNGSLYLHDSSSATFYDYSYKGTESVFVSYRGKRYLTSFEQLYKLVDEPVVDLDRTGQAKCKYTDELFIWDDDLKWTKVSRVIKKPQYEQMYYIRTRGGKSQMVTGNHPVITTEGDVDARNLTKEHKLIHLPELLIGGPDEGSTEDTVWALEHCSVERERFFRAMPAIADHYQRDGQVAYYGTSNPVQNRITMDYDMGWLIGFAVANGYVAANNIRFTKHREDMIERIIEVCEKHRLIYSYNDSAVGTRLLFIKSHVFVDVVQNLLIDSFTGGKVALSNKIFNYGEDFVAGVYAGILDGRAFPSQNNDFLIVKSKSRTFINQIAFLARYHGGIAEEQPIVELGKTRKLAGVEITAPNTYELNIYLPAKEALDLGTTIADELVDSPEVYQAAVERSKDATIVECIELMHDTDRFVYDVTTETGHFACNGLLSHNCYNYDLTRLATDGLYFLPATNSSPARHLTTFMAHLREFIVFVSNRSAGACALANFFVWVYYYWSKDVEAGYFIKGPEYYLKQCFQQFIYEVNQIHTRIVQSAYTNLVIMDRNYIEELFGGIEYPDGRFVIDHIEDIIAIQKMYLEKTAQIRSEQALTFPVLTYSLLYQNGKFVDEEFARWCSDHNTQWYDSNFYIGDSVTTLASCCRMTNDFGKLQERERKAGDRAQQFQSSIGGALVEIGSFKVSTINLAAIAYESGGDVSKFFEILKHRIGLNMELLDCMRSIYIRNEEKRLLPTYSYGLKDINKQTGTNGVTAMNEAVEIMGLVKYDELSNEYYTDEGLQFAIDIMDTINELQAEFSATREYDISCEVIPGESANAKLAEKDNIRFDKSMKIYSNQWLGLNKKGTINERIRLSAELDKKAGGGQILHISLEGSFPNKDIAWEMLNYIASQGVIYFAFNPKLYTCKHNHTFMPPQKICPTCGEGVDQEVTRIVGYLVPTKSFSRPRLEEYKDRRWYTFGDDQYLR